jgi:hypothetical protein
MPSQPAPTVNASRFVDCVQTIYVLLIWRGWSSRFDATEGADSFVIRDGKIRFQSIHYRLEDPRAPSPSPS